MAPKRIDTPRPTRKLRKRLYWGSKDAYLGLPRYDCQSPVHKRKKIKGLDCEAHAMILRQRLQHLLESRNGHNLHGRANESPFRDASIKPASSISPQQQKSTETDSQLPPPAYISTIHYGNTLNECLRAAELDPKNPKILLRLANIYTSLGRPEDALNTYKLMEQARRPSMAIPYRQRPKPIPMEIPSINPNFTAKLPKTSAPAKANANANANAIPLFDPSSLMSTATQGLRTTISTNVNFTGYTCFVGLGVQPPPYALLR